FLVLEEAGPQVAAGDLPDHLHEALVRRFVEPVKFLDLLDLRCVHALATAIAADPRAPRGRAAAFHAAFAAFELVAELLDRPAGPELEDDESDAAGSEQRRDHEQQPTQEG